MLTLAHKNRTLWVRGRVNGRDVNHSLRLPLTEVERGRAIVRRMEAALAAIGHAEATVADAFALYRAHARGGRTEALYLDRLEPVLADVKLADVTNAMIDALVTQPRLAQGLSPAAVRRELTALQSALNHARGYDLTDRTFRLPKPRGDRARLRWLTREEAARFLDACRPHFRHFPHFLLHTGLRLSEAIAADAADLDGDVLRVRSRKGPDAVERERSVPLHPALVVDRSGGALLKRPGGARYHRAAVYDQWNHARHRSGLLDVTPHVMRHTFASHLVMAGVDLRTVAELLGHRTMAMVQRYAHLDTRHLQQAVARLGDIVG